MIRDIDELLGQYMAWLRDKTELKEIDGWVEITTPFLDRHNDCIQIYARRADGRWLLSDDGYTLSDLAASGCDIGPAGKRRDILNTTLRSFGVGLGEHGDFVTKATDAEFAFKKHNLIQAMLATGDLFYLSRSKVISIFFEDVQKWFDEVEISYTPTVRLSGKSGFDHQFDFIIPHSPRHPERLVKLLNIPNKNTAEAAIFSCLDVRETRPLPTAEYAIINDQRLVPDDVVEAFKVYDVKTVLWSQKEAAREQLAA
jgi:hypothetical protein